MMPKLSSILFAILFYVHFVSARNRGKPFFDVYDDIIDDLRVQQSDLTSLQGQQDEGVQTVDNQRTIASGAVDEVVCKPRPIPVKIPSPRHALITIPQFVILNRCLGSPGYNSVEKCAVTKQEKVIVQYNTVPAINNDRAGGKPQAVMYDHLECGKECIDKPEDCNSNQAFDDCVCKCQLNNTYCASINRYLDDHACQCYCKVRSPCPLYQEWNPSTCQCECAGCIKEMCKKHSLALDSRMCKCAENGRVTSDIPY